MTKKELAAKIDHTLLKPDATAKDIKKLCAEARRYHFRAVCVNLSRARQCVELLKNTNVLIAVVNDFPFGAGGSMAKISQALNAKYCHANEIDTVINIGAIQDKNLIKARLEIKLLVDIILTKVIIETGYWNNYQIKEITKLAKDSGAFCIKTSTGFGPEIILKQKAIHVKIMKITAPDLLIKASGGIKTYEQAQIMIDAGADILGTSSGVQIIKGLNKRRLT